MATKRFDELSVLSAGNSNPFDDNQFSFREQGTSDPVAQGHEIVPSWVGSAVSQAASTAVPYFSDPPSDTDLFSTLDAKGSGGGAGGGGKPGGGGGSLLTTYTSGSATVDDGSEFNITVNFSGKWTADQQSVVKWAADFYSQIIKADVRDDRDLSGNLVDDIVISMSTGRIDGNGNPLTGNTLAQTSNIVVRDAGTVDEWLPLTASIKLDSTDLSNAGLKGTWDAIILHEMSHALGFVGAIFNQLQLVDGSGNFTGTQAVAAYGGVVPVENSGGSGTAGSHWDEATFKPNGVAMSNELMTGYFTPGEITLLSDTTIGALADLGYTVQDPSPGSASLVVDSHLLIA